MSAISEQKLQANRLNALKSTGPRTEEGKRRVSQNATTHGVFCEGLLAQREDPEQMRQFKRTMFLRLNPADALELVLVERIIAAEWKLKRIEAAENELYETLAWNYHTSQCHELDAKEERLEKEFHRWGKSKDRQTQSQEQQQAIRSGFIERAKQLTEDCKEIYHPNAGDLLAEMMTKTPEPLERLGRYQRQLENSVHRCLNQLRVLRKEEPCGEPSKMTEMLLRELDPVETNQRNKPTEEPAADSTATGDDESPVDKTNPPEVKNVENTEENAPIPVNGDVLNRGTGRQPVHDQLIST